MTRCFRLVCLLCACGASTGAAAAQDAGQPAPPAPREVQAAESRLQFYGFVRQDVIFDDSRPDAFQTPLFVLAEPPGARDLENLTMHPRLTRFGINMLGPVLEPLGSGRISGRLELDFQNGGRESRALPRFRHAFLAVGWRSTTLLIGQTADLISPLFPAVNADTLMWNAGNLGDRRAQVRLTIQPPSDRLQWSLAAAAGLPGAVDAQDLDADGVRDGEASARPNLQLRAGMSYPVGRRRLTAGVWSHLAQSRVTTPIAGRTEFGSRVFGADLELPIGTRAVVRGELWAGHGFGDVRGGIGQSVNRLTGDTIASRGGWLEAGGDVTGRYAAYLGYTLDAPEAADVPGGGRTRNGAWYIVNRLNAGRPFVFGVDYLRWTTEYNGPPAGTDNRVNAYVIYNF